MKDRTNLLTFLMIVVVIISLIVGYLGGRLHENKIIRENPSWCQPPEPGTKIWDIPLTKDDTVIIDSLKIIFDRRTGYSIWQDNKIDSINYLK
jgi:hypothetical protein